MKKLFLLLAVFGLMFAACTEGEKPEDIFLALDKEEITIKPDGGSAEIVVYSNYKWVISGTSDWCTPSVKSGKANENGQKVTFSADVAYDDREALFWFRCADKAIKLVVRQNLKEVIIADDNNTFDVPAEGGTIEIAYQTNVECEVIIPNEAKSWITIAPVTKGLVSEKVNLNVAENKTYEARSAVIKVIAVDNEALMAEYTINQACGYIILKYTSSNGKIVTPYKSDAFGATILVNEYKDGIGYLVFDAPVTSIGNNAFDLCSSLTSITIPDSVTEIGRGAFDYCSSLTSITIPDSVTVIGKSAFEGCTSLTNVTIGNGVTKIGDRAFVGCTSLTSITIPGSVTEIGNEAFASCTSLINVTIGNGVTSIGEYAFYRCSSLTSITIPDSVTSIGGSAFSGCSSLTSITIPDSVTSIGGSAFSGCSSLTSFYGKFASSDNRCLIVDGVLNSFAPANLTSYTIPDSVTSIGDSAFSGCSSLTSITIPDSVTSIGDWAFNGCSSLTSVTIPNSVTSIGSRTFSGCSSLTSVTIPNSVTSIGDKAFNGCSSLTSVTIPDSVTKIGNWVFSGCTSLKEVYCKPTTPPTAQLNVYGNSGAFNSNASGRKIYVPTASVDAYKVAAGWRDYADDIVGYDF